MPLIEVKCKNCGMNIKIDDDRDNGVCPYCETEYIIDSENDDDIKFEYLEVIVSPSKIEEKIQFYTSFKYKLVSNRIQSAIENKLTFKRPKRFKNRSKILELQNEYEMICKSINETKYSTFISGNPFFAFIIIGILVILAGIVTLISSTSFGILLLLAGIGLFIFGISLYKKDEEQEAKVRDFNRKLDEQIKVEKERLKEIIEEVSKL